MKNKFFKLFATGALVLVSTAIDSQTNFTAQYLGRSEYRHGYSALADTSQSASSFISQRLRLGAIYQAEKFKMNFAIQDIRTWGNTSNLAVDTKGFLSVYEANVDLLFNKNWTAKVGRQAISLDDDRVFGSLDWAMQGRRHDAAVIKYVDSTWSIQTGFAYNQNAEYSKYMQYSVAGNYKNFQYLWVNKQLNKTSVSFLFLNNGLAYNKLNTANGKTDSITSYSQTIGLRTERKSDKFNFLGYFYYQTGQVLSKNIDAYDVSVEVGYKPLKGCLFTLGGEILSGTSQITTSGVNKSFNPLYGTNHRFNGYMDYFYVGNHLNTVGLIDGYLRSSYTHSKSIFSLNAHCFAAQAGVKDVKNSTPSNLKTMNSYLGTELDFTYLYNFADGVAIQAGYSQMFGTSTLQVLKGGNTSAVSNWAYLMLIVRPGKVTFPKVGLKM